MLIDSFNIFSEKIVRFSHSSGDASELLFAGNILETHFHVYQPDFYLWLGYLAS